MNTIVNNLKKASVEIILLNLLTEEDMYGYQLAQEIKKRTDGQLRILEGSMYTILNRLKDYGDITCYQMQSGPRMVRVYYSITDHGRQHLEEMRNVYNTYVDIIQNIIQ